jgi:Flp pilus assembly protein TadD
VEKVERLLFVKRADFFRGFAVCGAVLILCCGLRATAQTDAIESGTDQQSAPSLPVAPSLPAAPGRVPDSALLSKDAKAAAEAGIEALGKNNFQAAETAFLQLLKLSPDNPSALVNLGIVEVRLGHPDDARKYLEQAIRVQPDAALAWTTLGVIYQGEDETEAATAALAQAVYLDPKSPQAHNYYGVTLAKRGWYDGAEEELQKAVELAPSFAEAQFNLAPVYFERHPPAVELARRHYQKALELGAPPDADFEAKLKAAPEPAELQ